MTSARREPTTRSKGAVPQSKRAAQVVRPPGVTGALAFQPGLCEQSFVQPRLLDLLECQYAARQTGYLVISHADAENLAVPSGVRAAASKHRKGAGVVVSIAGSVEL